MRQDPSGFWVWRILWRVARAARLALINSAMNVNEFMLICVANCIHVVD